MKMEHEYLVYRYSVYPSPRCHVGATRVNWVHPSWRGGDLNWKDRLPTGMRSGAVRVHAKNAKAAIKKAGVRC